MERFLHAIVLIALLALPTFVCIKYGWQPALISIMCILIFISLNEKVEKIALYGLKIELGKKLDEAEELLKKLRHVAEINGESIVNILAYTQLSFMQRFNFSYIDGLVEKTNYLMRELKIDDKKIRKFNDLWEDIYINKYASKLISYDVLPESAKSAAGELLNITKIEKSDDYIKKLSDFLILHSPNHDVKIFENLKHFIKTGKHIDKNIFIASD
jgi:hypothetical protein